MNVPSSIPRLKLVSYSLSHLFSLLAPVNKESYPKYRGVNSLYVSVSQLRKNNLNRGGRWILYFLCHYAPASLDN